jgi:DASH complex subunit ASK1
MRVPREDDYEEEAGEPEQPEETSSTWGQSEDHSTTEDSTLPSHRGGFDPNVTPSESSFMPGHAAVSSTPAKQRSTRKFDETPSWTSSIESSLNRLNEELDGLGLDQTMSSPHSEGTQSVADETIQYAPSPRDKGKSKAKTPKQPLLRNVLKQNTLNSSGSGTTISNDIGIPGLSSPLRREAAKILARMNPHLPSGTKPSQWNSVVDLSKIRLATHQPSYSQADTDDDSFGSDPGLGLSPPATIDWAVPLKRQLALGQTPRKEAAARIGRDLINNMESSKRHERSSLFDVSHNPSNASRRNEFSDSYDSDDTGMGLSPPVTVDWGRLLSQKQREVLRRVEAEESDTLDSMSSAPSLTRYLNRDKAEGGSNAPSELDLDSLMRRVGLDFDVRSDAGRSETEQYLYATSDQVPAGGLQPPRTKTASGTPDPHAHGSIAGGSQDVHADVYSPGDLSDSFDDERPNNTLHPSNAFILASQHRPGYDDSFGSGDSFSSNEGDGGGQGDAVHPFAAIDQDYIEGEFDDDSFDDTVHHPVNEDTDTIFGARHAQKRTSQQLRLLGEDLVEETQGYGFTVASQDSPTPAARGG